MSTFEHFLTLPRHRVTDQWQNIHIFKNVFISRYNQIKLNINKTHMWPSFELRSSPTLSSSVCVTASTKDAFKVAALQTVVHFQQTESRARQWYVARKQPMFKCGYCLCFHFKYLTFKLCLFVNSFAFFSLYLPWLFLNALCLPFCDWICLDSCVTSVDFTAEEASPTITGKYHRELENMDVGDQTSYCTVLDKKNQAKLLCYTRKKSGIFNIWWVVRSM